MWTANSNPNILSQPVAQKQMGRGVVGTRKFGVDITGNQNQHNINQFGAAKKKPSNSTSASTSTSTSSSSIPSHSHVSSMKHMHVENIDAPDNGRPQCVSEYAEEIHQHFRHVEELHMPPPNYMDVQKNINIKMRSILTDWLVEVHLKFKLMPETLYLTINLIDRYLARQPCARRKLQLVGVTCMLLASKYEEIYFPEVRDFVYITDKAYSRDEILQMEGVILNTLKFDLTVATPLVFLKRFLKAAKADENVSNLAHFFTERMLQEYGMLRFTASQIAGSAVSMALRVAHRPAWTPTLQHYAKYTESQLQTCVEKMSRIILAAPKQSLQAVRKKYSSMKYAKVSTFSMSALRGATSGNHPF